MVAGTVVYTVLSVLYALYAVVRPWPVLCLRVSSAVRQYMHMT